MRKRINNNNKKKNNAMKIGQKIRAIVNNKIETKITDITYTNTLGSTSYIYDILQVSSGTGNVNNRIGFSISPFKYSINITLGTSYALTGQNFSNVRLIVFKDLQQKDATVPVVTDILSTANVIAPFNYFNIKRFKIYKDVKVKLNYYDPSRTMVIQGAMKGETRYSGSSSSTINKNGLYFLIIEDNTANPCVFNMWSRVSFKDA